MSDDKGIRFLLCSPAITHETGSNIFLFQGEKYKAIALFRNLDDMSAFAEELLQRKIAKVIFHNEGKNSSNDPHTFIGWVEYNLAKTKAT
jgi:hypothetical protein